jgi:hypothetical protein
MVWRVTRLNLARTGGAHLSDDRPYTRDELRATKEDWPLRGPVCRHCGTRIPQFRDLSPEAEDRVRLLIRLGNHIGAMAELAEATECPERWAKIWVMHDGRSKPGFGGPPCPHCGEALASPRAKQCLSCGADWHGDPGERQ